MVFKNGKNSSLLETAWGIPKMGKALNGWFQPMVFTIIVKEVNEFRVDEIRTNISFKGVWQPFTAQQLQIKSEGQRAWRWFTVHAEIGLWLKPDDVVEYRGVNYRVMEKLDYTEYEYSEYHLIQDYEGIE